MPERITAEDILRIKTLLDPRISPDGKRIAFVVKRVDEAKNKSFTNLWMAPSDGSAPPREFTTGDNHDAEPRWSPDGRFIAFISDRVDETPQVYVIPTDGGEARKLTDLPEGGLSEIAWSPDGGSIAFIHEPVDESDTKAAAEARKKDNKSTPPRRITRLMYRLEGTGWLPSERPHLWVTDVATGETKQLGRTPNGEASPCWSPDGTAIACVVNRRPDPDFEPLYEDILLFPVDGGEPTVVAAPDGPKSSIAFSPDGSRIAWIGHTDVRDTWGSRNKQVWSAPVSGDGPAVCHTTALDRPAGVHTLADVHSFGSGAAGPAWDGDARILFIASDRGSERLMAVSLADNHIETLLEGRRAVLAFTYDPSSRCAALLMAEATAPAEICVWNGFGEPKRVTGLNDDFVRSRSIQAPEEFTARTPDGREVHGWVLKPAGFDPSRKYPMVLQVHGGPHTQYGWSFFHEFQFLAAEGYVVVYTNPSGSVGYSEDWARAIKGQWGIPDFDDLMAAVDHVLALGFVDEKRMAVAGGSYGGFMTAWVIGHTNRFRCAIADRGVYNLVSMAGQSDFPWDNSNFDGYAWDWSDVLLRHSPLTYSRNVTTPVMILHSEGDLRCPVGQAEEYFAALKALGKEVVFLRFPAESNHGLSRGGPPDLRVARLKANAEWFRRHLTTETE
jgi:dipeptidyl aminopeptidase/acylaminoacyl peptidase